MVKTMRFNAPPFGGARPPASSVYVTECVQRGWVGGRSDPNASGRADTHGTVGGIPNSEGDRSGVIPTPRGRVPAFRAAAEQASMTARGHRPRAGAVMNRFVAFLRALLFLVVALPIGAATLALLIAGWTATAAMSITPLGVLVLMVFRRAIGLLAAADAALARSLLGIDVRPSPASGGTGYWRRGWAVLTDGGFWRQQVYLVLRMTLGFALAVAELSLIAASLGCLVYPAWYRWSQLRFGPWHVDTLPRSLVLVPLGPVGLAVAVLLTQFFAAFFGRLARALLGGGPPPSLATRRRALAAHASASAIVGLILVLIWALTGRGYVWPEWALLPLALVLSIHGWIELVEERAVDRKSRGLAI